MSMLKTVLALSLVAGPVFASGLEVEIAGPGANGTVVIDLFEDTAPGHAERLTTLAKDGAYDNIVFHRVIDGFMAQTGDVEHGVMKEDFDMRYAGAWRVVLS